MTTHKVMLLGEIGVGKSSLVRRLVLDRFDFDYKPTLGVDIYRYEVPEEEGRPPSTFIIWDTDGNFSDRIFSHIYMRKSSAALIIGDVTRRATLDAMIHLADGFRDAFPGRQYGFVVNKLDLIQDTETDDLPERFLGPNELLIRTSAKTGSNVKSAFHDLATTIARREQ